MCFPYPPRSTCPRAMRLTCLVSPLPPQLPLTGSCIPSSGSMCMSSPDPARVPVPVLDLVCPGRTSPLTKRCSRICLCRWEFVTSLPFDWQYISGKKKFKWPLVRTPRSTNYHECADPHIIDFLLDFLLWRPLLPSLCFDWHVRLHLCLTTDCMRSRCTDCMRRSLNSIVAQNVTT